jgi:predicted nucleic acid-binding protein
VTLVIDASVALSWCFKDGRRAETDAIGRMVSAHGAIVPSLFHLEIANVLLAAVRRRRVSFDDVNQALAEISLLPVAIDDETPYRALSGILPLARSEGLTAYDASYLELAMRLDTPLATLDTELAAAAHRRHVVLAL